MTKSIFGSLLLMGWIVSSCATYKPYNPNVKQNQLVGIDQETTNVFLIGDAGMPNPDGTAPKALTSLEKQFNQADKNDLLLFLGDNIYPKGIPLEGDKAIQDAKKALNLQLHVAKTFPGQVYFIPETTIGTVD